MDTVEKLFKQSIDAVLHVSRPEYCLPDYIPPPPQGKLIVIGAGKASAEMARVFEKIYLKENPKAPISGAVVTRYGHSVKTKQIKVMEASHPVPDTAGIKAVDAIMEAIRDATPNDLIVSLLSGGGSALLTAPIEGIEFDVLRSLNQELLLSGASISEINCIRKHLNRALGGGLALAAEHTPMITLAISDVNGNDPSVIASGPTIFDDTTLDDCFRIFKKYNIEPDYTIESALKDPRNETAKSNNPVFANKKYHLIATPEKALEAAEEFWKKQGFYVENLGANIDGDTNKSALLHAQKMLDETYKKRPCVIISGGETTVKVAGNGKGGPNTQFILKAAIALNGAKDIYAMAYDTDGIDGSENNGGAICAPDTLKRAESKNLDPHEFLHNNDSYSFFKSLDDLIITGPTHTNVNDYRVILHL